MPRVRVLRSISSTSPGSSVHCKSAGDAAKNGLPIGGQVGLETLRISLRSTPPYSTVTLFARFRGWSTSVPFTTAT